VIFLFTIAFNSNAVEWTDQDVLSMDHYTKSIKWHDKYYIKTNSSIGRNNEYLYKALEESNSVKNSFLDKVHPHLKKHFRDEYEASIKITLESINHNLSFEAKTLSLWMANVLNINWEWWSQKNYKEFKYPPSATKNSSLVWRIFIVFVALITIFILFIFTRSTIKSRRLYELNRRFEQDARGAGHTGDALSQLQTFGLDGIKNVSDNYNDKINKLFLLAKKDRKVNKVLNRYQIDIEQFKDLYGLMIKNHGQAYIRKHWIPASSLMYAQTLEFLIKNKDNDNIGEVVHRLVAYFENDESGYIKDL